MFGREDGVVQRSEILYLSQYTRNLMTTDTLTPSEKPAGRQVA